MTDRNYELHQLQRQYEHCHQRHDEDRRADRSRKIIRMMLKEDFRTPITVLKYPTFPTTRV